MFRVLTNFPVCASVHAPNVPMRTPTSAVQNLTVAPPVWEEWHTFLKRRNHQTPCRVRSRSMLTPIWMKTVWSVCNIAKSSWKFHGQREGELKSRVSKTCWCLVCQKMQKVQNWKNAKMQKGRSCKLKIHSKMKCAAMLVSESAEHLHLTYFLTTVAVTAPNQESMKPCFNLHQIKSLWSLASTCPEQEKSACWVKECQAHLVS